MPDTNAALLTNVRIVLEGQLPTADEIAVLLGVAPMKYWRAGGVIARSPLGSRREVDTCIYSVRVEQPATLPDPGEAVTQLLGLFPDLSAFSKFGPSVTKSCVLGVTGYTERPYASLSPAVLGQLALSGVSLYVDFYDLSGVEQPTQQ